MLFYVICTLLFCSVLSFSLTESVQKATHDGLRDNERNAKDRKINFDTAKMLIGESINYAMKSIFVPPPAKAVVTVGKV